MIDIGCDKNLNASQKRRNINYYTPYFLNKGVIVLLIESPHISEYSISPPAPAWGKTETHINKHLLSILNNSINLKKINQILNPSKGDRFDFVLVNSIRYQCSLATNPLEMGIRDKFFKDLWDNQGFQCDLCERLKILNPSLIINAVTSNLKKGRCNTNKLPLLHYKQIVLESNFHPCRWNNNTTLK